MCIYRGMKKNAIQILPLFLVTGTLLLVGSSSSFAMARRPPDSTGTERASAGMASDAEIEAQIENLGKYSGSGDSRLGKAIEALRADPKRSAPSLMRCFADKARKKNTRVACSLVLKEGAGNLRESDHTKLLNVLDDSSEDDLIRVEASGLLLRSKPNLSRSSKRKIRRMAFGLFRKGVMKDHIVMSIFNAMGEDRDVENFLVDQLKKEPAQSRRDGMLHLLAKRKTAVLVGIIAKELESGNPEQHFSLSRMYLALGDIGSRNAVDLLIKRLEIEPNERGRRQALRALGASKSPRAKAILLDYLQNKSLDYYTAALDGIKYLGDKTVLPDLAIEERRDLKYPSRERRLKETIRALKAGNDRPFW